MEEQLLAFHVVSSKVIFMNFKGDRRTQVKYNCTPSSKAIKTPSGKMLSKEFLETNSEFSISIVVVAWDNEKQESGMLYANEDGVTFALHTDEQQLEMLVNMKANGKQPKGIDVTLANAYDNLSSATNSSSLFYEMKLNNYSLSNWTVVI